MSARSATSTVLRSVSRPAASTAAQTSSTMGRRRPDGTTFAPACARPMRDRAAEPGGAADNDGHAASEVERMAHIVCHLGRRFDAETQRRREKRC